MTGERVLHILAQLSIVLGAAALAYLIVTLTVVVVLYLLQKQRER